MIRLIWIGVLTAALCIPLGMVSWTAYDRSGHREEAVRGMSSSWGEDQRIVGPALVLPFERDETSEEVTLVDGVKKVFQKTRVIRSSMVLLPDDFKIIGDVKAESRYRGIYRAAVYSADLEFFGTFPTPDFVKLGDKPTRVLWDEAVVTVMVSDLRGTKGMLSLNFAGKEIPFLPGNALDEGSGITASLRGIEGWKEAQPFRFRLNLAGSGSLQFAPVGKITTVDLKSPWPDPGFSGSFLPTEREIRPDGFHAKWDVSYYGRKYSQQFYASASGALRQGLFGVDLVVLVDGYRSVLRALKYSILFVGLVFMGFFIYEVLSAKSVHTVQYLLVGLALSLFFLMLLALAEFVSFPVAYGLSAVATVGLIFLYCKSVLGNFRSALCMGAGLTAIHVFLFTVLQLEDYSLLAGTVGLFIGLALVMYLTRRVNWSGIGQVE